MSDPLTTRPLEVPARPPTTSFFLPVTDRISEVELPGLESKRQHRVGARAFSPEDAFETHTAIRPVVGRRAGWQVWLAYGLIGALIGQVAGAYTMRATGLGGAFAGSAMFTVVILGGYIFPRFQRNSFEIWNGLATPRRANLALARDLTALFGGILLGFALLAGVLGADSYAAWFDGSATLLGRRPGLGDPSMAAALPLMLHNLRILLLLLLVGVVFRYLGLLFAMVWNAAAWGVTWAAALQGLPGVTNSHLLALLVLILAAGPHLLLEAAGYCLATSGGIFARRGLDRYRVGSRTLEIVSRAALHHVGIGATLVVIAALVEGCWAPLILRWLTAPEAVIH